MFKINSLVEYNKEPWFVKGITEQTIKSGYLPYFRKTCHNYLIHNGKGDNLKVPSYTLRKYNAG